MSNDIEIRVKVANQTGAGLTSAHQSLRTLKTSADQASGGLRTLTTRSAESSRALSRLESHAQQTTRALTALSAAGDVRLTARLDNRTTADIDSIKAGLRRLKAESPVLLQTRFDGNAGQITAAANAMRDLRNDAQRSSTAFTSLTSRSAAAAVALHEVEQQAEDASRALRTLRGRAVSAAAAMAELRTSSMGAANGLRSFNTTARNSDGRLSTMSDRSRTLRRDTDDLDGSMRRLVTTMGGLRGSTGTIRTSMGSSSDSMSRLRGAAIALSPALIPIAAAAMPIAASVGAAGIAVGAFGLAIAGQIGAMKGAADAQAKYAAAVAKHGPASKQAAQAEAAYLEQVEGLDPATRKAAASLGVLGEQYNAWSKSLAKDTMPVFTKSLAVAGAMFPKLTPVVKGAATQLDRFMTILGGGVNSSGFSTFMTSFAQFSTGALSKANDGLVRFMRTMSGGAGSSQLTEFMTYVKRVGPQVGETLTNLGKALVHLVAAASETGASLLSVVNAFAALVNALPTSLLSSMLQFALVMKTVRLAAVGLAATGGGLSGAAAAIGAMRTAAAGATGALGRMGAAFGALSTGAKFGAVGAGLGLLVVGLVQLSKYGKQAPPDIDKLTTSLGKLAMTGKASGEASRVFGKNLSGLYDSIKNITDPSTTDKIQQGLVKVFSLGIADSTPHTDAKERLDAIDKALTNLARGGKANLAAQAFKDLSAAYVKSGGSAEDFKKAVDGYNNVLADQALEARLTAESMGLFGDQALAVQTKLDAQKASADALRNSIEALNDANRSALGGMIGFEAAIDAAAKAAKENAGSLRMVNGQPDVDSPKAQAAASALNELALKTKEAALANREATGTWEGAIAIYERGRQQFIKNAEAMGLNREEATALAQQIMQIPDKTARVKMETEDAKAGLEAFNAAVKRTPSAKSVTLKTLSSGAEKVLEDFGFKVTHLKNGSVKVTAAAGQALSAISNIAAAIRGLDGRTATTYVKTVRVGGVYGNKQIPLSAHGGLLRRASGGSVSDVQHYPEGGYVQGPGGPTSDSILATFASGATSRISATEYVVQASSVRKYGVAFLDAVNAGRLKVPGHAKGGLTKGQLVGLSQPQDAGSLKGTLGEVRTRIKSQTSGQTEKKLLATLDSVGKKLLAHEKQLISVNKALSAAKDRLNDLRTAASQLSGSVRAGVMSASEITKGASGDGPVTMKGIMSGLIASRDKATAFSSALKGLQAKGLRADLIQQIAEAGINGGGLETAGALLGASSSELDTVNGLQSQIASAAKTAGQTTANAVYAKAITQQTASVNKLQKSQDKLEKAMSNLTKSLNNAMIKAVGHKASGGIVGAAASGGIRGGLTWVGEHEPELLELPVGSRVWSGPDSRRKAAAPWASMLNTPRGRTAPAAPVRQEPVPVVLEIRAGDRGEFTAFLVRELRRAVRFNGSIEAVLKPPRGA
ncbi:phage tail protein [Streptomyces longwoodensis]|uniref:phage tail protein n=1 Tax=Streptomyces longwoodensis TaxID=68231 RepID=UPI0033F21EE8